MKVDILEAKNRLSELIKSAQMGQDVVIANRGQPVARLVRINPLDAATKKRDILSWAKRNSLEVHTQKSAVEIDASILLERQAWD